VSIDKRLVHHGAQPTPEFGVDKLPCPLPSEILIVELVIFVQEIEVVREGTRRREAVDVDV
jgi:hypothetical protein